MCFGNPFYCKSTLSLFFLLSTAEGNESSTINSISLTIITSINQNFYGLRFLECDGRNSSKKKEMSNITDALFFFLLICGDGKIKNRPTSLHTRVFLFLNVNATLWFATITFEDVLRRRRRGRRKTERNRMYINVICVWLGFSYRVWIREKMYQYTFGMISLITVQPCHKCSWVFLFSACFRFGFNVVFLLLLLLLLSHLFIERSILR